MRMPSAVDVDARADPRVRANGLRRPIGLARSALPAGEILEQIVADAERIIGTFRRCSAER
jgi:hypothetical protein